MSDEPLLAPQLIVNSRMLHFAWIPADREAVAALVPEGLAPAEQRVVYINQYLVDSAEQTSGFGAYSLTYVGAELAGVDAPDGGAGRWWTHYFNSSATVRAYASERGVPAEEGTTSLEIGGETLVATTFVDGSPLIRSRARVGPTIGEVASGHLRYITRIGGRFVSGRYPYVAEQVSPFEVVSCEFLDPTHSVHALRPKEPLEIAWGFYSPRASFCYPGGEEALQ
jgi:hypothetical protein